MKKRIILSMTLLVLCVFTLCGCEKEEVLHLGLNAEIIEFDLEDQKICVKDTGESGVFQEKCYIDCNEAIEKHQIFYCNYETHDVQEIKFENLQVGDEIIIALSEKEFSKITEDALVKAKQIQLGTQRLK